MGVNQTLSVYFLNRFIFRQTNQTEIISEAWHVASSFKFVVILKARWVIINHWGFFSSSWASAYEVSSSTFFSCDYLESTLNWKFVCRRYLAFSPFVIWIEIFVNQETVDFLLFRVDKDKLRRQRKCNDLEVSGYQYWIESSIKDL